MTNSLKNQTKPLRLITIPVSHYCEKARWALTRLKFSYIEEGHTPPFHLLATSRVGGKTTPVLLTQTDVLTDSTEILKYLDSIAPANAKLYPTDPHLRRQVEELEEIFNLQLGPATRCWGYFHVIDDYQFMQSKWCQGVPFLERALFPVIFPFMQKVVQQKFNVTPESAAQAYEIIQSVFAKVGELLADGRSYLVGNNFSAADLTFAALAAPTVLPPEHPSKSRPLQELPPKLLSEVKTFRKTPAGSFALRLYHERN